MPTFILLLLLLLLFFSSFFFFAIVNVVLGEGSIVTMGFVIDYVVAGFLRRLLPRLSLTEAINI